jgi:hypothetical protein
MKPSASSCSPLLSPPLARLCDELEADPWLSDMAAQFRTALEATEREADDNWHASEMMRAFGLIAEQKRSVRDRIADIAQIIDAPRGPIRVTIRRAS